MKNVYFVQVDVSECSGAKNVYLPYTAGILVASAWTSDIVKNNYKFKEFIFLRDEIDNVVNKLEDPAFIGFSNYCWSTEYNKLLAKAVKDKFPDCIINFGGHNVPDNFSFLEEFSYIDILSHGEGEETIKLILEAIALNKPLEDVPNISFRMKNGEYIRTETKIQNSLDYPSPYLDGWFEDIFLSYPDITFNTILETSRGCPYSCAYCDWGLLKSKTRLFPFERIKDEIKWMSDHKIAFVWGADANFGMFERDIEIAKELASAKKRTGFPEKMRMNYAKNNFENVFEIVKIFSECEFDRIGATLSFQSLSPVVLDNIGRKNGMLDFYKNLLEKYNKAKMRTYSELILGLPGETYESFIQGIGKLFEIGQHFVFEVYNCILLPNAIIGQPEYMKKHGIRTVRNEIIRPHFSNEKFAVPEYNLLVVETNTMSRKMWIKSNVFYYIVKALHGAGLLRIFALYLYNEKNIPYESFYDSVLDYFEENPDYMISGLYAELKQHADDLSSGVKNARLTFEPFGDAVWDNNEYVVLHSVMNLERFYEEMIPFLKKFNIEKDIFDDLLKYQMNIIRTPFSSENIITLNYDIHGYISGLYVNKKTELKKMLHTLVLKDSDFKNNWIDFAKYVVWYGRMGWSSYKDDIYLDN